MAPFLPHTILITSLLLPSQKSIGRNVWYRNSIQPRENLAIRPTVTVNAVESQSQETNLPTSVQQEFSKMEPTFDRLASKLEKLLEERKACRNKEQIWIAIAGGPGSGMCI